MSKTYHASALALALSSILASASAFADGRLTGRVSDQAGEVYFQGAIVRIDDLNMQTATREDGRFALNAVPAGEHDLSVSYVGAETVTVRVTVVDNEVTSASVKIGADIEAIENVLIIGQAAFINRAINQMRSSDNLVSVVTSDAIGQLPDENVSEALQRVPGVFIERDQGEGRYVGIRGIDSNLNLSSINGVAIAAPEGGRRSVALDVIPSDLVESIEVSKTLNADMDGQAIGGAINIKSLSAFDRDGLFYKVSANTNYSELQEEFGHKLTGSITNVFELGTGELGVAAAFSSQERKFGSEDIETDGGWEDDFADTGFIGHEEMEARDYEITRSRDGFALNLDYRATEDTLLYSRYLYSQFSDQEYRNRFEYKLDEGDIASISNTSLLMTDTEVQRELKDRFEEQEIHSFLIGGETQISKWKLESKLGYSQASEEEPNRIDASFENSGVAQAGYANIGSTPELVLSADGFDPSTYEFKEIEVENNLSEDDMLTFNLDAKYDLNFGKNPGFIKLGMAFRDREKTNDGNAVVYEDDDVEFLETFSWADFSGGNVDYSLSNLGPSIRPDAIRSFLRQNRDSLETSAEDTTLAALNDYAIEEDVSAAYIMSQIDINDLRLTYGLRFEQTEVSAVGTPIVEGALDEDNQAEFIGTVRVKSDYSHLLPSINARYNLDDDKVVRVSYFKSIGRPSFGELNPTFESENDDGEFVAEDVGNPNLQPFESNNFDLSFDYYPGGIGVISIGAFYKDIDNFIFLADITDSVDLSQFVPASVIDAVTEIDEFVQYQNGGDASILGVEFAYTKAFENGFLIQFNTTLSDSEADYSGREEDELPLINQSDAIGNLVFGYENDRTSLRLSTTHSSKRLISVAGSEFNDTYEDAHTQLDFSSRFNMSDRLQIFFNAKNLTNEPFFSYRGDSARNDRYEEYGQSFEFGLTYRNN